MTRLFAILLALPFLASCAKVDNQRPIMTPDKELIDDLKAIEGKRIYFGHQSVGNNILDGIRDILAQAPDVHLNVVKYAAGWTSQDSFFAQSGIGRNGLPNTKCDAFKNIIGALDSSTAVDIALMKFCFADFTPQTNVQEMFEYYQRTIDTLKSRYPRTTFVHVTAPLLRKEAFLKRTVKAILGRPDHSEESNAKVNEFNKLLRQRYHGDPLFDLATIESTYPDGARETAGADTLYTLVPEYTSDGGHLNELGRVVVARGLIRTLAKVARSVSSLKSE